MASVNVPTKRPPVLTHEGAPAAHIDAVAQLRRSVLACMLWEDTFYESGVDIATRIATLSEQVPPQVLADLAVEARNEMHLRHVPLQLLNTLTKTGRGSRIVPDTFVKVIQRADELSEFLAIYWKDGKHPISAGAKKGLARAFANFDSYQLRKYKGDGKVRLRDVMFLTHPKPVDFVVLDSDDNRTALYKSLADDTATAPDTWEVALSGGADKRETFTRLLTENKLGYLALLRNLKGMLDAGVDVTLIDTALRAGRGANQVLPFRYIAALKAAPQLYAALDAGLSKSMEAIPTLNGTTVVLVDVSASMNSPLSQKSDMMRLDAAAALATFIRGDKRVFTFSDNLVEVAPVPGLGGIQHILSSQVHGGTLLGKAVTTINSKVAYDRLIVITDEQSSDRVPDPTGRGYMINVASYRNGVGYGKWVHLDGFSENVIRWIAAAEAEGVA